MRTAWLGFGLAATVAIIVIGSHRRDVVASPAVATPQGLQDGKKVERPVTPDEKAVQELVDSFVKAYNAKDAKAIAAQFVEDGRVVGPDGSLTEGRDAIERRYREAFEDAPDAKIEVKSDNVRLLSPDVVLEEGHATFRDGDETSKAGRYHALYVRKDGRWLQSSIYDFAEEPAKTAPADHLKDLDWLLGEWVDEGDGVVAHTTCHLDGPKAFLIREFDLKIGGKAALSGTQRIGWDPSTGQFRSWVFDSEGGFSEGRWTRDGDRWVIKNEGYVPDGRVVSATNIISREGKDRMRWTTMDQTLGGESLENDAEVILVRKPPTPK